ncbi:MAG: hypothetical protein ACOYL6_16170 [Bacteriovoracaceae bacterium]
MGNGGIIKGLKLDVYNSIGLNLCPEEMWNKLSVHKIKKEFKKSFVKLNGPRYWTMDAMESSLLDTNIIKFGELGMRKAGIVSVPFFEILGNRKPYKERKVNRKSIWIFYPNEMIYLLEDPTGKKYIMQSYSTEKKPLTINELSHLNSLLKLPKGWAFRPLRLEEELRIPIPENMATVIQDEFYNTYTLIE